MEDENMLYNESHDGVNITIVDTTSEYQQNSIFPLKDLVLDVVRDNMVFTYAFRMNGGGKPYVRFIRESRQLQVSAGHDCGSATIEIIPLPAFMFDNIMPPQSKTETLSEGDVQSDAI